jgi:hypothetical protein
MQTVSTESEGGAVADEKMRTGSVTSRRGRIKAARINTGLIIDGAADDETVRAAIEALKRISTGDVSAARGIESAGEINVGVSYKSAADSGPDEIAAQLVALRQALGDASGAGAPAEVGQAAAMTDQIIDSMRKRRPNSLRRPKAKRVRELVDVLARAGMLVETASGCATAVATALQLALDILGKIH